MNPYPSLDFSVIWANKVCLFYFLSARGMSILQLLECNNTFFPQKISWDATTRIPRSLKVNYCENIFRSGSVFKHLFYLQSFFLFYGLAEMLGL